MSTQVIRILKGFSDGRLELSDNGHTRAKKSETIIWQIAPHSGVHSITRIEEKKSSQNIFKPGHPFRQSDHWKGDIKSDVAVGTEYRYSIFWKKDKDADEELEHDPIISIRPSTGPGPIASLLIAIAVAIIGIFVINYLQRKKGFKHQFKF